jgi:hypothetical protein
MGGSLWWVWLLGVAVAGSPRNVTVRYRYGPWRYECVSFVILSETLDLDGFLPSLWIKGV